MNDMNDLIRLQHMLDAAQEVIDFTKGRERSDLDDDKMLLRALAMSIGILGEAASRMSEKTIDAHSEIPWQKIIGMRNFLIHEYFRVDPDILWETAMKSIPPLVSQLQAILSENNNSSGD